MCPTLICKTPISGFSVQDAKISILIFWEQVQLLGELLQPPSGQPWGKVPTPLV